MTITREVSEATNKRLGQLFLILALVCLALTCWMYSVERSFIRSAHLAKGVVIEVRKNQTLPTIRYIDVAGNEVVFQPRTRSSLDEFSVGETVEIWRRDSVPAEAKVNQWSHLWSGTSFAAGFCIMFSVFAGLTLSGKARWGPLKQDRLTIGGG